MGLAQFQREPGTLRRTLGNESKSGPLSSCAQMSSTPTAVLAHLRVRSTRPTSVYSQASEVRASKEYSAHNGVSTAATTLSTSQRSPIGM